MLPGGGDTEKEVGVHQEKMGKGILSTEDRCTKTYKNKSLDFSSGKCWWSKGADLGGLFS